MEVPQQDETERRSIRQSYRKLTAEIKDKKEKHTRENGGRELHGSIKKADEIYKNVQKPREQAVDGEVYGALAQHGLELVNSFQKDSAGCSPAALIARLKQQHVPGWDPQALGAEDGADFGWAGFSQRTSRFFKTPPSFTCMLGPVSIQIKERKKVERRVRQTINHELINPEQVKQTADAKQQETDRNMKQMLNVLKKVKRASLAQVINNPLSFGQTVENLFTLSFLVRNGRATYVYAEDGVVDVEHSQPPGDDELRDGTADPGQFVFRFNMADWQEMQEHVGTPTGLIPHREYDATATGQENMSVAGNKGSPGARVEAQDKAAKCSSQNRPRENASQETEERQSPSRQRARRQ